MHEEAHSRLLAPTSSWQAWGPGSWTLGHCEIITPEGKGLRMRKQGTWTFHVFNADVKLITRVRDSQVKDCMKGTWSDSRLR